MGYIWRITEVSFFNKYRVQAWMNGKWDAPVDGAIDALGAGSPHTADTTPLSGTQINGAGPASAVTADADGDVSVGGGSPGGASTKGTHPDAVPPPGEHPGGG